MNKRSFYPYGLTHQQVMDCYNAGRSPKTGRLLPRGPATELQRAARKANWRKLQIVGAIGQLERVVNQLGRDARALHELSEMRDWLLDRNIQNYAKLKTQLTSPPVPPKDPWAWDDPDTYGPS